MRLSEFWTLMDDEFGRAYSRSVARDHVLTELGGRTADEALEAGYRPRRVWEAVCEAMDVPPERRLGKDPKPRR
ncbi:MAG TPA: DUF3046 domain-containing protein [Segeticoccus sp.]|nr:DUF3046 domain-containing protein [Segeticoccus sp.]